MADGRSKQRPGVEIQRRRILDAALSRFAARGSASVSVREICQAAEVSRPTFYRCFADKDAVLAALYDEAVATPIRWGVAGLDSTKNGRALVNRIIDALFARSEHLSFLFAEARDPRSVAHAIVERAHEDAVEAIVRWQEARGQAPLSRTTLRSLMVAWQWMVATHLPRGDAGRVEVRAAAWELARITFLDR